MHPAFIKPLSDITVKEGEPIQLISEVVGFPAPEIKWYKDGMLLRPGVRYNFINNPNGQVGLR